jgi:hypothetical protein
MWIKTEEDQVWFVAQNYKDVLQLQFYHKYRMLRMFFLGSLNILELKYWVSPII